MTNAPSWSSLNIKGLYYIAFAVFVYCFYAAWIWYQGVYSELQDVRASHTTTLADNKSRATEQRALYEEIERLKTSHDDQVQQLVGQINTLNNTFKEFGYANHPNGRLPGGEDVVIVVKTGATEAFKALPIHLSTTLTHTPDFLLFSDHEQQIGQYHIQDSLDEMSEDIMKGNKDFDLYREQKTFMALGQSPEFLELKGGWDLDKYKNIHMLAKTWQQRPNAKWYVFIDADSYLVLSNLFRYLDNLDHNKRLYMGSGAVVNDVVFAHGGTGYAISQGAVKHVMEQQPTMAHDIEKMASENCCGDYVIAEVMKKHGIDISNVNPVFQGEPMYRIDFHQDKYCKPVVSLHHMRPEDVGDMWTFERSFAKPGEYILFQDIFEHFIYPHLKPRRDEWDCMSLGHGDEKELPPNLLDGKRVTVFDNEKNDTVTHTQPLSDEEKKEKVFAACHDVCKKDKHCLQFRTWKQECKTRDKIELGWSVPRGRDDIKDFTSGWMMDRVEEMRKMKPCKQPKKGWPKGEVGGS